MTWAALFGYSRWRQLSARAANRAAAVGSSGCADVGAVAVGDTEFAACTVELSTLERAANWQPRRASPIQSGTRRLAFLFLPGPPELKIIHLSVCAAAAAHRRPGVSLAGHPC